MTDETLTIVRENMTKNLLEQGYSAGQVQEVVDSCILDLQVLSMEEGFNE